GQVRAPKPPDVVHRTKVRREPTDGHPPSARSAADSTQTLRGSADASCRPFRDDWTMNDAPVLICYDGSPGAVRAIETAVTLLGPRRAVVVDMAPPITAAESLATVSPAAPDAAFEEE